jgi:hypothetical protein
LQNKEIEAKLKPKEIELFDNWNRPFTIYEIMDILDLSYTSANQKLNLWLVRNWIKKLPSKPKSKFMINNNIFRGEK